MIHYSPHHVKNARNTFCPHLFDFRMTNKLSDQNNSRPNIISKFATDFYEWLQRHLVSNRVGGGNGVPAFSNTYLDKKKSWLLLFSKCGN